jgi:hypothetical protein
VQGEVSCQLFTHPRVSTRVRLVRMAVRQTVCCNSSNDVSGRILTARKRKAIIPANQTQRICTITTSLHPLSSRANKTRRLDQGHNSADHPDTPLHHLTMVVTNINTLRINGTPAQLRNKRPRPNNRTLLDPDGVRFARVGACRGKTVASARPYVTNNRRPDSQGR